VTARAGADIEFRSLREADLPLLAEWLGRSHVRAWWDGDGPAPDLAQIRRKWLPRTEDASPVRGWLAWLDGVPIGFIQSYVAMGSGGGWWEEVTDPGVRGIDQFLADERALARGLGSAMVRAFVAKLFEDGAVTRVQTDPDPANARAIRCYEKAGFRAVKRIVTPDGPALLMVVERPANRDTASPWKSLD
jgi:RimJ/RimL family protein N-acetyltransferase